ncbi:MAG: class I SAM-dependent methyltransferase [Gemmatimonadetes bacterium]|jgi:SAM-dependent methyltransferase|nr:class I SAM-dependent methyltransferase [Gemmatimonadota bacterium]MBT7915797.1 class I SAM-dependent methyltransferase [Candidatus Bathyarchaeota archaeon]
MVRSNAWDPSDPEGLPPNGEPVAELTMHGLQEKEVLCLAGGGGHQSAVYSLLGAKVTVFDLTPEQLDKDQMVARHYGYEVTTIQGDMRDLSALPRAHFDRVVQPISSLYVPDMCEVYREVATVLKPGGMYSSKYTYAPFKMAERKGWDGEAYVVRFSQPNVSGRVLERASDGLSNFTEGQFLGEFNHLPSDIINGQIAEGLAIMGIWENHPGEEPPFSELRPGSGEHESRIIPNGLSVVSRLAA